MKAQNYIKQLLNQIEEGEVDPIVGLYELMDILELATEAVITARETAFDEVYKFAEKEFIYKGRKILKKNGAGRWNYEPCTTLIQMEDEVKSVKKLLQQGAKSGQEEIQYNGEMVPAPIYKEGPSSFSIIKLKK